MDLSAIIDQCWFGYDPYNSVDAWRVRLAIDYGKGHRWPKGWRYAD